MKFNEIISSLKKKEYKPIYFLMGDESYYIDEITNYIVNNVLQEHERDFNQTILYGKDTNINDVVAEAKRFPMMSEYQVVVVKEAQHLSKEIEKLQSYAETPLNSTILVFNYKYKKLDKRKAVTKAIGKTGVVFESEKLRDYQIPDWIQKQVSNMGFNIEPKSIQLLANFLGTDLGKINNELGKLKVAFPKGTTINNQIIQDFIGVSKDYNVFELQSALAMKDVVKANEIINYFSKNPKDNPLVLVLSSLYGYFTKILITQFSSNKTNDQLLASELKVHPFFLKEYKLATKNYSSGKLVRIISYLKECDLKSKGIGATGDVPHEDLLKEMIFKILH